MTPEARQRLFERAAVAVGIISLAVILVYALVDVMVRWSP